MELEIARVPDDIRIYINVFSLEVGLDESKVPVAIFIDDNRYDVLVDVFQGGQRFLLPAEIYAQIIDALSSCSRVTIALGRYKDTITCSGFAAAYANLLKI